MPNIHENYILKYTDILCGNHSHQLHFIYFFSKLLPQHIYFMNRDVWFVYIQPMPRSIANSFLQTLTFGFQNTKTFKNSVLIFTNICQVTLDPGDISINLVVRLEEHSILSLCF